jgi:hypothetical protein
MLTLRLQHPLRTHLDEILFSKPSVYDSMLLAQDSVEVPFNVRFQVREGLKQYVHW